MAWTEKEISDFRIINKKVLDEINSTLKPKNIGGEKIGIFCPGQNGDCMTASSVLKYRDILWPDKEIVWFCNMPVADFLKHSDISEVRPWPWRGNGLPLDSEDYWPMLTTEDNRLDQTLKLNFPDTVDITEGYFPAPYMLPSNKRHGISYPNCSKRVFGIPDDYEWHPVIKVIEEEKEEIMKWFPPHHAIHSNTKPNELVMKKAIAIETFAGSGQSLMSDSMVRDTMRICRQVLGECYFIFVSHKYLRGNENFPEDFKEDKDIYFSSQFTVRQCSYVVACCQLLVSVSSGVTVAASCWDNIKSNFKIIQFCGSGICATKDLSKGRHFELITADNKLLQIAQAEFGLRLEELLNQLR